MKVVGYILSIAGLGVIGLSNKIAQLSFLANLGSKGLVYTAVAGVALVAVGIVLVMGDSSSSSKVKQVAEEVPIYEGEGKNRRIVGYKKSSK